MKVITTKDAVMGLIEQALGVTHFPGPPEDSPAVINEPAPRDVPITTVDDDLTRTVADSVPVDDDDYIPSSLPELSRAAGALVSLVPPTEIEAVYREIKRVVRRSKSDTRRRDEPPKTGDDDVNRIQESKLRTAVRKILSEAGAEGGAEEIGSGRRSSKGKWAREASLDDIAKEMGFAAASGVRQFINIALNKARFLLELPDEDRQEVIINAISDYISYLKTSGELTDEEVSTMMDNPDIVSESEEFRDFLRKYWIRSMKAKDYKTKDLVSALDRKKEKPPAKRPGIEDTDAVDPEAERERRMAMKADRAAARQARLPQMR